MEKKNKIKECEAFIRARHILRTRGRKMMPKGYKKDPTEYEWITLNENNNKEG